MAYFVVECVAKVIAKLNLQKHHKYIELQHAKH